jgi:two-component system chemotaxis sensor kinase CheA
VTDFLDTFLDDYFAECDEHLITVRRTLLALESSVGQSRPDPSVTEELFRAFHSLKGIAGMVEHREIETLAHEMETYLRALREGEVRLTTGGMDTLIEATRTLEHAIAARRHPEQPIDVEPAIVELRQIARAGEEALPTSVRAVASGPSWQCFFTPSPELIARGINVDGVRARLRANGDIISATPVVSEGGAIAFRFVVRGHLGEAERNAWRADGMVCSTVADDSPTAVPAAVPERPAATLSTANYVRVDLARLDDLMRMIGDLVIRRARLAETVARVEPRLASTDWRGIQENMSALERQLRELREGVMRVRLVPVGEIFRRMPFVVRDLARETGKRVKVDVSGQATEIDKFIVERMLDPVLHVVRNAVAHGLETVDERIAAGKTPEGAITLTAAAAGEMVTIEIADDGRGVDAERVIARARVAGLAIPAHVDEAAILELIASPGFSTREATDRVSGRGFGMAVVRSTVQELGGTLHLASTPGHGTRFTFELPLTLAITDALIARVGGDTFAVPQASVREVIELDAAAIHAVETGELVQYRGGPLPIVRLSDVLAIAVKPAGRLHAFVVGAGGGSVALVVDRIVGQREIVVRSTSDPLIRVEGIAGATDLGDGRAVLILDAAALARHARPSQLRGRAARARETA